MNPWIVGAAIASSVVLLWAVVPGLRGWLLAGVIGASMWGAFRTPRYPEGRSKAHGVTKEQLRKARAVESWLLEEEQEWVGEEWRTVTRWDRITEQAGITGSNVLRVEAIGTGFHLRVELAPGATIDQARPAVRSLESALDVRPGAIEVEQDEDRARVILLRVTPERTVTAGPIPWPGPVRDASILKPAQLGVYQDGGPLEALLAFVHVLIAGATDAGKSGVLNILVGYLAACRDVELRGIDLKDGVELGPWEETMVEVARSVPSGVTLLRREQAEMDRRYALMAARKQRKWQPSAQAPARVTVIDEQRVLGGDKDAVALLEDITGRGRAAMVTVVISTQYPTVPAIGSNLIANNCNLRICLRVSSSTEANVVLGKGMAALGWEAHRIPPGSPGTLYLFGAESATPRLARAFYASDDKVEQVARKLARAGAPRPGPGQIPPVGAAPPDHTESDEPGLDGGGEAAILAALPAKLDDLADRLDTPRTTLYRRLVKLRDAGRVENRDGLWWAVP